MNAVKELVWLFATLAAAACGGTATEVQCASVLIPPIDVRIGDARTGALIAGGARVIWQEHGQAVVDTVGVPGGAANDSAIVSVGREPGTYDFRVEKAGYAAESLANIVVPPAPGTQCNVPVPVAFLILLHPAP